MFKYATLGGIQNSRNNPRTKAEQKLLNGMVVIPSDVTGKAPTPKTVDEAKAAAYVVNNIIDKPEIRNSADFAIEVGEYVHADFLPAVNDLGVELDEKVVAGFAEVVVGDQLVPAGDGTGQWVKADGTTVIADEYAVKLQVVKNTTFGGKGLLAEVKA
jgi:hypothetical protein